MNAKVIGRLIGVATILVALVLSVVPLDSNLHSNCGSALFPDKWGPKSAAGWGLEEGTLVCEDEVKNRRNLALIIGGVGVLITLFGAEVITQKPNKPFPTYKKPMTEADFQEQQRAKTPLRQEPEPQWKEADPKPTGEKKFCSQCGEKLTVGAKFCSECGTVV
tara:strand:+ start:107 stop:595 length:489 start_codon:yes stop_codon:yes gene_type:complete